MADINSALMNTLQASVEQRAGKPARPATDAQLLTFVELLFFAYRDFTREADAILAEFGLGRAHHRVIHFVNRHPGLRVADLLEILKITKQSLARVLKQLVDEGWIVQKAGQDDRRQRRLHTTDKGAALADRLDSLQARRIAHSLSSSGAGSEISVARFLFAMISEEERIGVEALLPGPVEAIAAQRK